MIQVLHRSRHFVKSSGHGCDRKEVFVLSPETESAISRKNALRLSNEESNRITKESIEAALIALMRDREFDDISITDIIKKAGVSRSAYYRNYSSKEDILSTAFTRITDAFLEVISEPMDIKDIHACFKMLFDRLYESRDVFDVVLKAGMIDDVRNAVNTKFLSLVQDLKTDSYYGFSAFLGAVFNIVLTWKNRGYSESSDALADICEKLMHTEVWPA